MSITRLVELDQKALWAYLTTFPPLLQRFSPCSLRSIRAVLLAKAGRCFTEPEESFCGNLRVEGKEECDAGLLGSEDNDSCCDKFCNLRRNMGAACSDKNSPCCKNCQLMPAGQKCREAQKATCEQEAKCTGIKLDYSTIFLNNVLIHFILL